MAVVGDAYVMIRAITSGVDKDIKNAFKGADKIGGDAGDRAGRDFKRGFARGGGGGMFEGFIKESEAASRAFSSLTRVGFTLSPLFAALGGTIGVLGTSLISLGSIIGAITVPAIAVLGGALTALAQAAITAKLAFAGVGKAISAGNKAAKKGTAEAKALQKAETALERALKSLSRTREDAAKSEKRAKRDLIDAEKELHEARQQAIEDLEQLSFDSEDAAIAEQRAAIELEKARETLARVSDLPPNSRARKEAELAFASADLNYRRAIDKNNDLKKAEAKNAAMGDTKKQIEGQDNVVKALRAVTDAEDGLTETKIQNTRAISDSRDAVKDAAQAVKDIEDNKAATDAYADALSDLSPEAQKFVKFIVSLKEEFKKLKAAAGKDLFPLLEVAIQNLVDNLFPRLAPLLQGTGKVLGKIAVKFSKTVTSAENLARLEKIWKTNDKFLGKLGDAASNLYEVFLILLDAAEPLIDAFGDFLVNVTAGWKETLKADEATGKLAERFKIAKGIFSDLGKIFGNVFGGLGKLFEANTGPGSGGQIFLDYFKKITESFKNLKTIDGKPLKEFFAGAAENGTKLLDLIGKIFGGFIRGADNPALGVFFVNLGKAVDIISNINLDGAMIAISEFVIRIAEFIAIITESGSIEIFFGVLTTGLEMLNNFLKSDLGQTILETSAKILPFLAAFGLIAKVGGYALKVVVGGFSRLFSVLTGGPALFRGIMTAVADVAGVFGLAVGPFLAIVAAIAAVVAVFVIAYKNSEVLRKAVSDLVSAVGGALKDAFTTINDAIKTAAPGIDGLKGVFKALGDFLGTFIVPIFKVVLVNAIKFAAGFIATFITAVAGIAKAFGGIAGAVSSAFSAVMSVVKSAINTLIRLWNSSLGKLKINLPKIGPFGGGTIGFPTIPQLAEGGVVYPKAGGTIARVAEAGRAERIEPLDADGLSVRDRAIIAELSGPGKGTTINMVVNPSAGMDERQLAAIVSRQIAFQTRRGAA